MEVGPAATQQNNRFKKRNRSGRWTRVGLEKSGALFPVLEIIRLKHGGEERGSKIRENKLKSKNKDEFKRGRDRVSRRWWRLKTG